MKRVLSLLFCLLFVCSLSTAAFAADANLPAADEALRFNEDGTFRIIQFTDTHTTDQPYAEMQNLIKTAVETYDPDLVVFTGDNIKGYWNFSTPSSVARAIDAIISPLGGKVPFACVFGNHDWQALCLKSWQVSIYQMYPNNLTKQGFTYHHRRANYNYIIKDAAGEKALFNLWFMDSGSRDAQDVQNCVKKQQIEWYEKTSAEIKKNNGGKVVPSIVFQHVPVQEITKLYKAVPKDTEGAIKMNDGNYYVVGDNTKGELHGSNGFSPKNEGQYDSWVKTGDVVGAFFGHDHTNDVYGATEDGIILGSTKTAGFQSRGDGHQGFRVIDLDAETPETFETYSVYYCDLIDENIPEQKRDYDNARGFREWILGLFRFPGLAA